jgi:nucleoprotein TPR
MLNNTVVESERLALQVQTLLAKQQGISSSEIARASTLNLPPHSTGNNLQVEQIIISQLTTFRDIQELQQQNQRLLKVTQDLATRLEQEEDRKQQRQSELESEAIAEAQQLIEALRDRLKTAQLRIDSYTRERDLLRRMLDNAGKTVPNSDSLISEVAPTTPEPSTAPVPAMQQDTTNAALPASPEMRTMLRELQEHFDAYRKESGADLHTLKEQLEQAQNQCTTYRIEVAQANAQITYLNGKRLICIM